MIGYIVVEPDLSIEQVPEHLLDAEDIRWPPEMNTLPEAPSGKPVSVFSHHELYHRYNVADAIGGVGVYVWSRRDPNALPGVVLAAIVQRAKSEPGPA